MSKKAMYDLRDMLCEELDEIARKGELGTGDLEIVHKLTDTIKNIDKIETLEEGDYSGTYGRGSSYARRGTHYVRGHYSRTDANENLRSQISDLMRETDDDRVKEALRRAISAMEE